MIDATGISTKILTDKVIANCKKIPFNSSADCSLVDKIYAILKNVHNKDGSVNFEDIFHVLELLRGFRNSNGYKGYTSLSKIFAVLNDEFSSIDAKAVYKSIHEIITTVNDEIANYDKTYDCKGTWFKEFFERIINGTNSSLDIYNLNYDTWVEQTLRNYNDGYVPIPDYPEMQRFDVKEAYNISDKHWVCHPHGQICFEYPRFKPQDINNYVFQESNNTLYKYKDFSIAKKFRDSVSRSDDNAQSGETLIRTNIITGLMKTDKLLWNPFNIYHTKLSNSLMNNNQLILLGYGFSDLYINNLLLQFNSKHYMNRKVLLIDYINPNDWSPLVEHPFSPSDKALFTNYISKEDRWYVKYGFKNFENLGLLVSENQELCVCKDGFKASISKMDEIINYIK